MRNAGAQRQTSQNRSGSQTRLNAQAQPSVYQRSKERIANRQRELSQQRAQQTNNTSTTRKYASNYGQRNTSRTNLNNAAAQPINAGGSRPQLNNISSTINEMKQDSQPTSASAAASAPLGAPVSQDAIDDKLSKLQGLLKMAKNN